MYLQVYTDAAKELDLVCWPKDSLSYFDLVTWRERLIKHVMCILLTSIKMFFEPNHFRNKTDIRIYLSHRLRSVLSDFPDCLDLGVGLCTGFPGSLYSPPPPPGSLGPDRWTGPQTWHGTGEGSAEHSHSHFLLYSSAHLNNNSNFDACFI